MNSSINLKEQITFGQTFSYTFRFMKASYLKMLPLLALFFIPALIIFFVAVYPCFTRLTPIFNDYIQILGGDNPTEAQWENLRVQFYNFLKFAAPLLLIALFSIILGTGAVMESIKKKIEQREESLTQTLRKIFTNHIPFFASMTGVMMILSFVIILTKLQFYATPVVIYTISLFSFLPQLSYFGKKGVAQSFRESFLLSRKRLFFLFGFLTLLYLIYIFGSFLIGLAGALLISFIDSFSQETSMAMNMAPENIFDILDGKSSAKTLLVFAGIHMITAQFFLIPFFSIATSLHYFSFKHRFPESENNGNNDNEPEFLPESLPL